MKEEDRRQLHEYWLRGASDHIQEWKDEQGKRHHISARLFVEFVIRTMGSACAWQCFLSVWEDRRYGTDVKDTECE